MDAKPNPQLLYTPKALAACEKALRTILKKIGPWGTQLILIGGMTPKYLVGNAPKDIKEHVGTTDLDVVVGVALSTEEEEAYRTLQQTVVEEITKSPILDHGDAAVAVGYFRKNFASIDHSGPAQYARFEQSGGSEEERAVLQRYAHGTMTEFLKQWDERKMPSQG